MCQESTVNYISDEESDDEDHQVEGHMEEIRLQDNPREVKFNTQTPTNAQNEPATIQDDDEDRQPTNVAAEFLRYHLKYNHAPTNKLQEMACQGTIPKRLAKCDVPICAACMFRKATRRQW
jgi:hypothetical protein